MRRLAENLEEPTERVHSFGEDFTRQLNEVDQGIQAIVRNAPQDVTARPEGQAEICEFFSNMRSLAAASDEGLGALNLMLEAMAPVEAASRDLRRPLKRLRQGLTLMYEGRAVINNWVRLIDATSIECPPAE